MVPQSTGSNGRDIDNSNSEEEEDEEWGRLLVEEEFERDSIGDDDQLMAFNSHLNGSNDIDLVPETDLEGNNNREEKVENSNSSNLNLNLSQSKVNTEGGVEVGENMIVKDEIFLGHEGMTQYEDMGRVRKSSNLNGRVRGGLVEVKGGVYSDGPRSVYNKLNLSPISQNLATAVPDNTKKHQKMGMKSRQQLPVLPSASLRRQHHLAMSMKSRNQTKISSHTAVQTASSDQEVDSQRFDFNFERVTRNPPSRHKPRKNNSTSLSSAGSILCCSSFKSSDICNCNKKILEKHEFEAASKISQGAIELGVEGEEESESFSGKRKLWKGLLDFKLQNDHGEWCLGGDFNAVLKTGERRGCSGGGNGSAMSRLDCFLLSEGFIEKGGISNQWIGDRDISDHCPIWLVCSNLDWGPKPFKFNNCWLEHPNFIPFVTETWKKLEVKGKKAYVLKEKLKRLKDSLNVWNREVFGIIDLNINKTVKELNEAEDLIANGNGDPTLFKTKELVKSFWDQILYKESLLHQKARTKWIQEGDSNSRFFHASIKSRRRRNQLVMLKKGEGWIQGVTNIKKEVKDHFAHHFTEEWNNRPFLQGITFNTLSSEENSFLLEPFTEEEVKDTIWSCDGNKSPGPDGLNFNFLKSCWCIVKYDVMAFLSEFHDKAILPKAVTASFLTLIPKKDHPQDLFDYRSICLIGSLYKIVSKILANWLKRVLGKLISNCQSAFLPSRQILDGVVVLNEIIDLAKRRKDNCLLFKVDFERAYDTVNWNYLERMMTKMGFSEGWLKWMRTCVFQSSMSILVNGSPTEDFNISRGLRQGDPLSPFLFLIVVEGLAGMMKRAIEINRFKGFQVNDNIQFQILQFADDTILMGEGPWDNIRTIKCGSKGIFFGEEVSMIRNCVSKWKWRMLVDGEAVWTDLLKFRYGHIPWRLLNGVSNVIGIKKSLWWKDVLSIGRMGETDWFKSHVRCSVGNGDNISFSKFQWIGDQPFQSLYLNLFAKETFQDAMISDKLNWRGATNLWNWQWRENLSVSEHAQLQDLQNLLTGISFQSDGVNKWRWVPDLNGIFSVNSCYTMLIKSQNYVTLDTNILGAILQLWKSDVPTKVCGKRFLDGWAVLY
ncbi:hypothetical protein TSUD_380630 [Trifolium subterraneum]|uniref:Reverse transcriptase domain-containing protein n=1 Tax=Trifolium subterraneum TaxID=3900 RepID=A0A2Z6NTN2_TRISU|nr:hypothetical protein TSUD_380630 [Trifolium subterraneum]